MKLNKLPNTQELKTYEVRWVIEFSHEIRAKNAKEAMRYAEDMGDVNAMTRLLKDKRAKRIR